MIGVLTSPGTFNYSEGIVSESVGIFIIFLNFYLFNFGCAGSSLPWGLFSHCSKQELLSSCNAQASRARGLQ